MGKPTKRERKFQASGGVKRRLEKGGMATKGKPRKRQKQTTNGRPQKSAASEQQPQGNNQSKANDFLSDNNLGDLDIDSFFEKLTDAMPNNNNENGNKAAAADQDNSLSNAKSKPSHSESEDSASASESDDDDLMIETNSGTKNQKHTKKRSSSFQWVGVLICKANTSGIW